MMWNALQTTPQVDVARMLRAYVTRLWYPAYRAKTATWETFVGAIRRHDRDLERMFRSPAIRQRLRDELDTRAARLHTVEGRLQAYALDIDGRTHLVLLDPLPLSADQWDGQTWDMLAGEENTVALLGAPVSAAKRCSI